MPPVETLRSPQPDRHPSPPGRLDPGEHGTLWRDVAPEALEPDQVRAIESSLRNVAILREPRWSDAVGGDVSTAVAIAIDLLFAGQVLTPRTALVMTLLLVLAARGSTAAALVLRHGRTTHATATRVPTAG